MAGPEPRLDVQALEVPKRELKLTHHIFRYPAKFHPPVVRALLEKYTHPGQTVLDPFVGSGTALVECSVMGRGSIGIDVDPVAVEVARAKTRNYDMQMVEKVFQSILSEVEPLERSADEYVARMFEDLSDAEYLEVKGDESLWIPEIPRLHHWFRRYVLIDLARILAVINSVEMDERVRALSRIAFAAIIRNASNADPVPVSGLEYTSHMKRKDEAGRLVNPFALLRASLKKCLAATAEYLGQLPIEAREPLVLHENAMEFKVDQEVDIVLTSPPYHNAVDYYRRHQLEMFWLGHTSNQDDRLELLPRYIGRPHVAAKDPLLKRDWSPGEIVDSWEGKMRADSPSRAADFRHYVTAMSSVFERLSGTLATGSLALFVVGHSRWKGQEIPTGDIYEEISADSFSLREKLSYPIANRYMSYSRHNSASIDEEYVLVMRRL
ncbi:TRM11 family SAM-dependent methyltransferase [Streptomyces sp. NPDC094038]|uniref:TRM11 family SAM-dependent methyltransferase n=1 Tax=Streptomyces sp. NPDC094038 TaxID=3366055 RepID=UPI00380A19D1